MRRNKRKILLQAGIVAGICGSIFLPAQKVYGESESGSVIELKRQYEQVRADRDNLFIQARRLVDENRKLKRENEKLVTAHEHALRQQERLEKLLEKRKKLPLQAIIKERFQIFIEEMRNR